MDLNPTLTVPFETSYIYASSNVGSDVVQLRSTLLVLATPIRVTGSGRETRCRLDLASCSCGLPGRGLFGSCFDTYADTTVPFHRKLLQF